MRVDASVFRPYLWSLSPCHRQRGMEARDFSRGRLHKAGAWYSYQGTKIGQGRDATKNYLLDHVDIMEGVERQIRERHTVQFA